MSSKGPLKENENEDTILQLMLDHGNESESENEIGSEQEKDTSSKPASLSSQTDSEEEEASGYALYEQTRHDVTNPEHEFIVAVDLGTKYSGYAYMHTKTDDVPQAFTNWNGAVSYSAYKTPTSLLLDADDNLIAFGDDANDQYAEEKEGFLFFDRFKMTLYEEIKLKGQLDPNYVLKAVDGTERPAIMVFAKTLEFFRQHFLQYVYEKHYEGKSQMPVILWVLTVPAIWHEASKQFMRTAAEKAGLVDSQHAERLVIAIEPEAAALLCHTLPYNKFVGMSQADNCSPPSVNKQFLVVDVGGGTIDVTVLQRLDNQKMRECSRTMGEAVGGALVDDKFLELITDLFGEEFLNQLKSEEPQCLLKLLMNFELGKRKCSFRGKISGDETKGSNLKVELPYEFLNFFHVKYGREKKIEDLFADSRFSGFTYRNNHFYLSESKAYTLFHEILSQIMDTIVPILAEHDQLDLIYLVGGFSDCPLLRHEILQRTKKRVLVPFESGLAVLKGAVLFAKDPSTIAERVMRHSYGTEFCPKWKPTLHPESRRQRVCGEDLCVGCFYTFVRAGQTVGYNETIKHQFCPVNKAATSFNAVIYASPKELVNFVDDADCHKIANVSIELKPDTRLMNEPRPLELQFRFAATELEVVAVDAFTNERRQTKKLFHKIK